MIVLGFFLILVMRYMGSILPIDPMDRPEIICFAESRKKLTTTLIL
ncbi:Hypothetical protein LEPBI_I2802 [Leptospira biflexa serovar Patoc strain 'Patoc 1 (Paris)']|uniref:Uncharacterized protein n=1 Tax=Leptospira biflexa serovar Patoc (strain Patoc 1 / ATCC 23582 / Paris) TaxID=456481 RepID=B0SNB2_LEPBP|nr:Hypothetical protein LEPBI_I2802 [Leptospira biflexa serovar Patoc strain 'Patoc 1 (Paris)']